MITVLSCGVRSLFGSTRRSSPWGNFSDDGSFVIGPFGWLIDWRWFVFQIATPFAGFKDSTFDSAEPIAVPVKHAVLLDGIGITLKIEPVDMSDYWVRSVTCNSLLDWWFSRWDAGPWVDHRSATFVSDATVGGEIWHWWRRSISPGLLRLVYHTRDESRWLPVFLDHGKKISNIIQWNKNGRRIKIS